MGARRAWDDEPDGVRDGVEVRPSHRTEGCRDEAYCSFPAGPVAVLAAGDGERWGRPPTGAVWATRAARADRRSARARRASDMDTTEDHTRPAEERFRRTPTWRTKCQISGSGRPLRFEHWGAREDLSPTGSRIKSRKGSRLERRTHKGHEIYTGSGHHCGVIPYSSVWCVDCLRG